MGHREYTRSVLKRTIIIHDKNNKILFEKKDEGKSFPDFLSDNSKVVNRFLRDDSFQFDSKIIISINEVLDNGDQREVGHLERLKVPIKEDV